jgi:predicted Rossmann fold flavoprotein
MTSLPTLRAEVVVVGGGAAGMLAAAEAAKTGADTLLIEKNAVFGRKLRITGKGRCNVTNDCDVRTFMANVPVNGKFLYSAVSRFTPRDAMAYFEALGVPLKVERGSRVFPVSDRASDVSRALERAMDRAGVRTLQAAALDVLTENGAVSGVETDRGRVDCSRVILCTGGMSYPATGSTGDGYRFAQKLGHVITPPRGSLVPLTAAGTICRDLMGLSLRNVALTVFEDEKKIYTDFGEMLFTHFGLSGPMALSASAHMRRFGERAYRIEIDLKPALDEQKLDRRLLSDLDRHKNSDFINSLEELLPRKLIPVAVARSGIDGRTKCNTVTREQRMGLLRLLKHFSVDITGTRPLEEAIVTTGGMDVRQVDPRTMGSRLVPGLYFAGEILDTDAYTGGFNLQIAWSTAHLAGNAAAQKEG